MAEVNKMKKIIIILLILAMIVPTVLAIGVTRSINSNTITYSLTGVSGTYGVFIDETISGGCTLSDGTTRYSTILLNPETTRSITITIPASASCSIMGSWNLGTTESGTLPQQTFSASCIATTCGAWGICDSGTNKRSRLCSDSCGNQQPEYETCTPPDPCAGLTTCADGICRTSCAGVCATGTYLCSDGTCKATCVIPPNCLPETCGNYGVCIASGTAFVQSRYCTDACGNTRQDIKTSTASECSANACPTGQGKCADGTCAASCSTGGGGSDIIAWFTQETILKGIANWIVLVGGFIVIVFVSRLIK